MTELKPCECGGEAHVSWAMTHERGQGFYVVCYGCGRRGARKQSEAEAIAAWNRRTVTQEQVEALASFLWMEQGSPPQVYINQAQACLRAAGFEVQS